MYKCKFAKFFSKDELQEIARAKGFVERESPINGFNMLLIFTTGLLESGDSTLTQLVAFLNNTDSVEISPQALDKRINKKAVEFLKTCLEMAMKFSLKKIEIQNELFSVFSHIFIADSTTFSLSPSLKEIFKGYGGDASLSAMRIQLIYDYLSGGMYFEIGDVRTADATTLEKVVKNDILNIEGPALFLQDLGYFKKTTFSEIIQRNHFLLSKLHHQTKIFNASGQEIQLKDIISGSSTTIDINVVIGETTVRLVGKKLPPDIVNERIRKANQKSQKKKKNITKDYRTFLSWMFFITNLNSEFTFDALFTLYRVRWQIELVFKSWKSILKIHKIRSEKTSRIMCEVYGKLIVAVITTGIFFHLKFISKVSFSYYKILQYLKIIALKWALCILSGIPHHTSFLRKIIIQLSRFCRKSRGKNKPAIEELLLLVHNPIVTLS